MNYKSELVLWGYILNSASTRLTAKSGTDGFLPYSAFVNSP